MVLEQLEYLYKNPHYLEYLRYNPRWYKILYYDSDMLKDFINEANTNLHLRKRDTLLEFNKKLSFVSSLMQYLAKK
jgi:hypothetical protein